MPESQVAIAETYPLRRSIGGYFLPKNGSDPNERNIEIDYSRFHKQGIFEYKPLKGVVKPGIQFTRHDTVPASTLELQRKGRAAAAAGSVALNLMASAGLLYSGSKLLFSTLFNQGSEEEAYESLSSAYTKSSVAGVLTGLAHESPNWAIGNLGMGIFSRFLHDISGLAGFLFSDGLASIGMGQVRFREKGNALSVHNSIFDTSALKSLSFLKPIEQSIRLFTRRILNPSEWKLFAEAEPYALFNTAGGGLSLAALALGAVSVFKNKLSEGVKSFAYLPAGILSLGSIVALFRDGAVEVDRSHYIGGGKRKGENYTQRAEGYSKQIASPFLVVRNLLFALKGVGLDTSGKLHNIAVGLQSFGAAFAFLGFTAQSFLKFFNPGLFGPKFKQFIEIILEPKIAARYLRRLMDFLKTDEAKRKYYKPLDADNERFSLVISEDKHSRVLQSLMDTDTFRSNYEKSQAGLPNYTNEKTFSRYYLDRGSHLMRTCAIVIKICEALKTNTKDRELFGYLLENELALKIAALLHDIGHGPFSHVLDRAVPGHDNDRETILMIRDENSEMHKAILQACKEEGVDGKKVLDDVLLILGRWSPLYQLISGWGADRIDYIRFSDFPLVNNGRVLFPKWEMADLDNYANTFRLYKDESGNVKVGFTPEGALLAFLMCSDREIFDVLINNGPGSIAIDLEAALALGDMSPGDVRNKSEAEVAQLIFERIERRKTGETTINFKNYKGDRIGYSYYSPIPEDPTCINVVNGQTTEFLSYLKAHGIKKFLAEVAQSSETFRRYPIGEQELVSRIKAATTLHEFYIRVNARTGE